jgi:vacuolar protein sorting-associated protein IST1
MTPRKEKRPSEAARRMSDTAELNRATPPRGLQAGKSPVSVAPPGPRSDNPNPRVKVPGGNGNGNGEAAVEPRSPSKPSKEGIPELDELTRRFAALKR